MNEPLTPDDRASAEGLREAIRAALHELGEPGPGYPAPVANAVDILRVALPDSGIDVERLARAISRADLITATDGIPPHRWDLYAGTIAKELAREYARLSTPRTETSDGLLDAERDALL